MPLPPLALISPKTSPRAFSRGSLLADPPLPTAIFIIFLLSLSARFGSSSSPFLLPSPDPTLADVYAPPPQTHTHNIKTLNPNCLRHRFAHTVPPRSWLTTFVDLIRDRAQFPPQPNCHNLQMNSAA